MNNFSIMAAQLTRDIAPVVDLRADAENTKTASIRALLRQGPMHSSEIASVLGLARPALVGALLKHDLAIGRVQRLAGGAYALADEWEEDEHQRLIEAKALLRRHGYQVSRSTHG